MLAFRGQTTAVTQILPLRVLISLTWGFMTQDASTFNQLRKHSYRNAGQLAVVAVDSQSPCEVKAVWILTAWNWASKSAREVGSRCMTPWSMTNEAWLCRIDYRDDGLSSVNSCRSAKSRPSLFRGPINTPRRHQLIIDAVADQRQGHLSIMQVRTVFWRNQRWHNT